MTLSSPPDHASGTPDVALTLLTRLMVAFSRRRAYPETHPLVQTAEAQALEALTALLADRPRVEFSLGQDELLVDAVAVASSSAVARELADRLRYRGIGVLSFDRSVTADSLRAAIAWVGSEPEVAPDGTVLTSMPPNLTGVTLTRIAYGRLALGQNGDAEQQTAGAIWRVLASTALFDEADDDDDAPSTSRRSASGAHGGEHGGTHGGVHGDEASDATDGEPLDAAAASDVAAGIERRIHREGYAQRVAFVLLRVAEQVSHADEGQRAALGERLRDVLGALRASSTGEIIKSVGIGADQRRFISQLIDALPPDAIIEWLETAAHANDRTMSHQMMRLLSKLSTRAASAGQASDAASLRGVARDVVQGWTVDAPNSSSYLATLDRISRLDASMAHCALPQNSATSVLQMALEIDAFGDDASDAARALLNEGRVAELMQWCTEAPAREAAAALQETIASPSAIRQSLLREPLDVDVARLLLASLDLRAAPALLDVLRDAENRTTRRIVYDRLREFGPSLAPLLLAQLEGAPWYFVRNLLALMRDTAAIDVNAGESSTSTLYRFLGDQHEQVRLEALRLMLADANARDAAIRRALDDASERVVRAALDAVTGEDVELRRAPISPELGQRLCAFAETSTREEAMRVRAVRALGDAPGSLRARDLLLSLVTKRSLVLRRTALADVSPLMLAALESMVRRFATDARCAPVIALASNDSDKRIREAIARGTSRGRTAAA